VSAKIFGIWDGEKRDWIRGDQNGVVFFTTIEEAANLAIELKTAHDRNNFYPSPIPEAPLNRDAKWPAIVKR